jgi:hypothetical protein
VVDEKQGPKVIGKDIGREEFIEQAKPIKGNRVNGNVKEVDPEKLKDINAKVDDALENENNVLKSTVEELEERNTGDG